MADFDTAPLLEDVDISYDFIRYEGSLMNENVFRQIGSPEVDTAWESLGIECKPLPLKRCDRVADNGLPHR